MFAYLRESSGIDNMTLNRENTPWPALGLITVARSRMEHRFTTSAARFQHVRLLSTRTPGPVIHLLCGRKLYGASKKEKAAAICA
jgi:hypothetical protein